MPDDNGSREIQVTAEMVFTAVRSIIQEGKLEEFLALPEVKSAYVLVKRSDVDFIKAFLRQQGAHTNPSNRLTARVVDSDRCQPDR